MNFLRKLLKASPTDELALIPLGKLFLSRSPLLPKGELECLYNDACISIKKTTTAFLFQLTVVRAYQEGESISQSSTDYDDDDDENEGNLEDFRSKDEKVFFLTPDINARIYTKHDRTRAISWKDLQGDLGDRFEFLIDEDIRSSDVDHFLFSLFRCMYEHTYQKSSAGVVNINELSEFFYDPEKDGDDRQYPLEALGDFLSTLEMYVNPRMDESSRLFGIGEHDRDDYYENYDDDGEEKNVDDSIEDVFYDALDNHKFETPAGQLMSILSHSTEA